MEDTFPHITKIADGDSVSIARLRDNLFARGWSFVARSDFTTSK